MVPRAAPCDCPWPAGDRLRGGEVLVEERRRDLQRAGDVVEAVVRIVTRQQGRRVDLEAQQVAHRVGVFAVQAVQAHMARCDLAACRRIDTGLQPVDDVPRLGLGWPVLAWRRHQVATHLSNGRFPGLRIRMRVVWRQRLEREPTRPVVSVVAAEAVLLQDGPVRVFFRSHRRRNDETAQQDRCAQPGRRCLLRAHVRA